MNRVILKMLLVFVLMVLFCGGCGQGASNKTREDGLARLERGLHELQDGNYDAAVLYLEEAATALPANVTAQCNFGIACWKQERYSQAIAALKKAASLSGTDSRPLELIAQIHIETKRFAEAKSALEQASQLSPQSPKILTAMATIEYHKKDQTKALELLSQALDIQSDYAPALFNLAVIHRDNPTEDIKERLNSRKKAVKFFRKFLAISDDDVRIAEAKDFLLPKRPQSIKDNPASLSKPNDVTPVPSLDASKELLAKAHAAIENSEFDEALVLLNMAIKKNPSNPDPMWDLAILYKNMGYTESALKTYRKFKEQFPQDPRVVKSKKKENNNKAVEATLKTAQEAFEYGLSCYKSGNIDGAILGYKRALTHDNQFFSASYNLGLAQKAKGNLDSAKDAFVYTLNLQPKMVKARYMLAMVYSKLSENGQAIEHLKKALEIKPDYVKAHYLLGVIYKEEGLTDLSRRHFDRCLESSPDEL